MQFFLGRNHFSFYSIFSPKNEIECECFGIMEEKCVSPAHKQCVIFNGFQYEAAGNQCSLLFICKLQLKNHNESTLKTHFWEMHMHNKNVHKIKSIIFFLSLVFRCRFQFLKWCNMQNDPHFNFDKGQWSLFSSAPAHTQDEMHRKIRAI